MNIPKHPTLIRRSLLARQKTLRAKCPVLAASLVTLRRTCGAPAAIPTADAPAAINIPATI
jgi:hypothetical protein